MLSSISEEAVALPVSGMVVLQQETAINALHVPCMGQAVPRC